MPTNLEGADMKTRHINIEVGRSSPGVSMQSQTAARLPTAYATAYATHITAYAASERRLSSCPGELTHRHTLRGWHAGHPQRGWPRCAHHMCVQLVPYPLLALYRQELIRLHCFFLLGPNPSHSALEAVSAKRIELVNFSVSLYVTRNPLHFP